MSFDDYRQIVSQTTRAVLEKLNASFSSISSYNDANTSKHLELVEKDSTILKSSLISPREVHNWSIAMCQLGGDCCIVGRIFHEGDWVLYHTSYVRSIHNGGKLIADDDKNWFYLKGSLSPATYEELREHDNSHEELIFRPDIMAAFEDGLPANYRMWVQQLVLDSRKCLGSKPDRLPEKPPRASPSPFGERRCSNVSGAPSPIIRQLTPRSVGKAQEVFIAADEDIVSETNLPDPLVASPVRPRISNSPVRRVFVDRMIRCRDAASNTSFSILGETRANKEAEAEVERSPDVKRQSGSENVPLVRKRCIVSDGEEAERSAVFKTPMSCEAFRAHKRQRISASLFSDDSEFEGTPASSSKSVGAGPEESSQFSPNTSADFSKELQGARITETPKNGAQRNRNLSASQMAAKLDLSPAGDLKQNQSDPRCKLTKSFHGLLAASDTHEEVSDDNEDQSAPQGAKRRGETKEDRSTSLTATKDFSQNKSKPETPDCSVEKKNRKLSSRKDGTSSNRESPEDPSPELAWSDASKSSASEEMSDEERNTPPSPLPKKSLKMTKNDEKSLRSADRRRSNNSAQKKDLKKIQEKTSRMPSQGLKKKSSASKSRQSNYDGSGSAESEELSEGEYEESSLPFSSKRSRRNTKNVYRMSNTSIETPLRLKETGRLDSFVVKNSAQKQDSELRSSQKSNRKSSGREQKSRTSASRHSSCSEEESDESESVESEEQSENEESSLILSSKNNRTAKVISPESAIETPQRSSEKRRILNKVELTKDSVRKKDSKLLPNKEKSKRRSSDRKQNSRTSRLKRSSSEEASDVSGSAEKEELSESEYESAIETPQRSSEKRRNLNKVELTKDSARKKDSKLLPNKEKSKRRSSDRKQNSRTSRSKRSSSEEASDVSGSAEKEELSESEYEESSSIFSSKKSHRHAKNASFKSNIALPQRSTEKRHLENVSTAKNIAQKLLPTKEKQNRKSTCHKQKNRTSTSKFSSTEEESDRPEAAESEEQSDDEESSSIFSSKSSHRIAKNVSSKSDGETSQRSREKRRLDKIAIAKNGDRKKDLKLFSNKERPNFNSRDPKRKNLASKSRHSSSEKSESAEGEESSESEGSSPILSSKRNPRITRNISPDSSIETTPRSQRKKKKKKSETPTRAGKKFLELSSERKNEKRYRKSSKLSMRSCSRFSPEPSKAESDTSYRSAVSELSDDEDGPRPSTPSSFRKKCCKSENSDESLVEMPHRSAKKCQNKSKTTKQDPRLSSRKESSNITQTSKGWKKKCNESPSKVLVSEDDDSIVNGESMATDQQLSSQSPVLEKYHKAKKSVRFPCETPQSHLKNKSKTPRSSMRRENANAKIVRRDPKGNSRQLSELSDYDSDNSAATVRIEFPDEEEKHIQQGFSKKHQRAGKGSAKERHLQKQDDFPMKNAEAPMSSKRQLRSGSRLNRKPVNQKKKKPNSSDTSCSNDDASISSESSWSQETSGSDEDFQIPLPKNRRRPQKTKKLSVPSKEVPQRPVQGHQNKAQKTPLKKATPKSKPSRAKQPLSKSSTPQDKLEAPGLELPTDDTPQGQLSAQPVVKWEKNIASSSSDDFRPQFAKSTKASVSHVNETPTASRRKLMTLANASCSFVATPKSDCSLENMPVKNLSSNVSVFNPHDCTKDASAFVLRTVAGDAVDVRSLPRTRSGRLVCPPLDKWRGQRIETDADGNISEVHHGKEDRLFRTESDGRPAKRRFSKLSSDSLKRRLRKVVAKKAAPHSKGVRPLFTENGALALSPEASEDERQQPEARAANAIGPVENPSAVYKQLIENLNAKAAAET